MQNIGTSGTTAKFTQNRLTSSSSSNSLLIITDINESRGLFLIEYDVIFPAEDPDSPPGVQKNIVLFQGFCAMKYAIYALFVNAHKYSDCTECEFVQQQQHHQLIEADMDQTSTSLEGAKSDFVFNF